MNIELIECLELFWILVQPLLYLVSGIILTIYILYWIGGLMTNQGQQHAGHRKYIQ